MVMLLEQTELKAPIEQGTAPFLKKILDFASQKLQQDSQALEYLNFRGVTPAQIASLGLGYIPEDAWPPYLSPDTLDPGEIHYLDKSRNGFKLKGKLLFPLTNALGYVRGFQVRSPSQETKDYWKFYNVRADVDAIFFGTASAMPHIWANRTITLVEGIFDLFPIRRSFPDAVCVGTAKLNPLQVLFLQRHVDTVRVIFDNDKFGVSFWNDFERKFKTKFERIERVPYAGKDPSASWQALGEDRFQEQFRFFTD